MRTELRFGDAAPGELIRQLTKSGRSRNTRAAPADVDLGITGPAQLAQFSDLLAQAASTPMLIVCRPRGTVQTISRVA